MEPTPHARKQKQRDQADGRDSDGDEAGLVREALRRQEYTRPVDGDGLGHRIGPARVLRRQPRRVGGREDDADLPEAEEDLDLGCQAHTDVVDDSAVGKAERRADAGLLPPISHAVAKRCEAARDAEGEGDGDDVARSGADGEALVARVTAGELVMLAAQSWHSGP